jgi:hypothetical protein
LLSLVGTVLALVAAGVGVFFVAAGLGGGVVFVGAATALGLVAVVVAGFLAGEVAGFSGFSEVLGLVVVAVGVLGLTEPGDLVSIILLGVLHKLLEYVPVVLGLVDVGVLAVGLEVVVGVLGFSAGLVDVAAAGFSDCSFFKASFSSWSFSI